MNYKNTVLWNKAFGNIQECDKEYAEKLIQEYEKARDNTVYIVEKIRKDFPQLTIHDMTHIDALWQTGSIITGSNIEMNPIEGFILGCAFLFHDAVLSYEAAGGKDVLHDTVTWKDYYEEFKNNKDLSEGQKIKEADFYTIRFLHADKAKQLYNQLFQKDDGSSFYIIADEMLRNHTGEIIGTIAASHHWEIEEIEKLESQQPPMAGFPNEWSINPKKLACILRCADAAHLDSGRAPDHLLKILKINGISRAHWIAQNRLSQIAVDRNNPENAIIKSEISFSEEEFAAWNVVFDAITVLDHEIKNSNECLKKDGIQEFQIKSIKGANSPEELAQYIKTDGWMPCSARIHISDIEQLINNLGGEKLYGKEHQLEIALRELIQNSRDAIVARRKRESNFDGRISISIQNNDGITIITISDDGIGMSLRTIKECFLNFGNSYWSSALAKEEYPGLCSSGFKSVGQFGIGFYAVFMVASKVIVETRKYDEGLDNTNSIKFPTGLCLRPILSRGRSETTSVSTKIQLFIDNTKCQWNNTVTIKPGIVGASKFDIPYSAVLANLTAGLDVDVYYSENGGAPSKIHSDIMKMEIDSPSTADWLKEITYAKYQNDPRQCEYIDNNYRRLRKIINNDDVRGIAALNNLWDVRISCFDVSTVGGLSNCSNGSYDAEYLGCLIANPLTAKREADSKGIDLSNWAQEQYDLLVAQGLSENDRLYLPYYVGKYGIDMTDDMLVRVINRNNKVFTLPLLQLIMIMNNTKLVLPISKICENDRIENNINVYYITDALKEDEFLYVVERNSGFLELTENQVFPYNLMRCIKTAAEKCNRTLTISKEKGRVNSFFGICDAYVITVEQ